MGWLEWKYELDDAYNAYEYGRIDRETYVIREKYAIYMINRCGNKEAAEGIARAHGYELKDLIREIESK